MHAFPPSEASWRVLLREISLRMLLEAFFLFILPYRVALAKALTSSLVNSSFNVAMTAVSFVGVHRSMLSMLICSPCKGS